MATYEKHLGTLAGDEDDSRIAVVQVAEPGETPTVEFRMQRHGDALGWVTHRRMRFAAGQVGQLRDALNMMDPDGRDAERDEETDNVASLFSLVDGEVQQSG
jgi:hypothetical protein